MGYIVAYITLQGLSALNLIFIALFVKETISQSLGDKVKLFTLKHLKKSVNVYITKDEATGRRWRLITLLIIMMITNFSEIMAGDVVTYHLLDRPLCFSSILIGFYTGMLYLIKAVAGISCLVILHRWIGDLGLLLMGCVSGIMYQSLLPIFHSKRDLFIGERPGMFDNNLFLILRLIIVQKNDVVTLLHVLAHQIMTSLVNKSAHDLTSLKMLTQF